MKKMILKWLPFIFIASTVIISSAYLLLAEGENYYRPKTDSPAIIYREACIHCHGEQGQGNGILYSSFDYSGLDIAKIKLKIKQGSFMMPSFRNINDDTLQNLAKYIFEKGFIKNIKTGNSSVTNDSISFDLN
ncbi:MAG: cytochrome c [Calditrichaceae bacterium]